MVDSEGFGKRARRCGARVERVQMGWVDVGAAARPALTHLTTSAARFCLPADYVAEHAHLSYAATASGVQGATVEASHTLLTDSTSAVSVYVGSNPAQQASSATQIAQQAREEAELLRSLTPAEVAARIEQTRIEQAAREATSERRFQHDPTPHRSMPRHDGTTRGL
ncbi:MAG: hypothetical protein ACK5LO_08860 [Leucobacter sp.]